MEEWGKQLSLFSETLVREVPLRDGRCIAACVHVMCLRVKGNVREFDGVYGGVRGVWGCDGVYHRKKLETSSHGFHGGFQHKTTLVV